MFHVPRPGALLLVATLALALSAVATRLVCVAAQQWRLVDFPNDRSSHGTPTPSGGGLGIVISILVTLPVLWAMGAVDPSLLLALAGGIPLAVIGFMDDRRPLSPILRLALHVVVAVWALSWLGGVPALQFGSHVLDLGWLGDLLGIVGIVWTINLFNFMDGIDGLAGSEAVFITGAGAMLTSSLEFSPDVVAVGLVAAAASAGFLLWNWPPARIFMGDIGSGFLGFLIAVLGIAAARSHPVALFSWQILGSVFFVDATITLARRLARRERIHHAHRSHAYQRLARRWKGHRPATLAVIGINCLWTLPLAALSLIWPKWGLFLVLVAAAPIAVIVFVVGAGLPDDVADSNPTLYAK